MPTPRRLATLLAGLALSPAALRAAPEWSPPVLLDTRLALEIAPIRQDPTDAVIYLPILFQNPLDTTIEIGIVDTSVDPPGFAKHVTASGTLFALGAAGQVGDRVGFSYVDSFFDGRFGTCADPCFPSNHLVSGGTYLDSASAASADDFFVALVDNAVNHAVLTRYSTNGGTSWQTLHTTLPAAPGGVYPAFEGGKRLQLVVDPDATDPAQTRNCLLYEIRPTAGTTALRLNCRNGATEAQGGGGFNVILDTDIPNPSGTFDKFIQTDCLILEGGGGDDVVCVYSHRQTQETRIVRVSEAGQIFGPDSIASTSSNPGDYGISLTGNGDDEIRVLHPSAGESTVDATATRGLGVFPSVGPPGEYRAVAVTSSPNPFSGDPLDAFLWGFLSGAWSYDPLGSTDGLFVSFLPLPLFADGFELGNVLRWTDTTP
jgi:hypothetical protein